MGYVPPSILIAPTSAERFLAGYEKDLRHQMLGRDSIWPWRRRRAYAACLTLIRSREAICDLAPDPWALRAPPKPPRPVRPTYVHR